jgi:hypothetical protein
MTERIVYFATRKDHVVSWGEMDRREAQVYVNRNNAAAARRGDPTKPYSVVSFKIEERS